MHNKIATACLVAQRSSAFRAQPINAHIPRGSTLSRSEFKKEDFVARFRALLGTKQLNVNLLSKHTERLYGASSPYFIPHNFCYNLLANRTSPHICQVFALSKLAGYSFSDCLTLFGFSLENIIRFQLKLHQERTVLLPSVSYSKNTLIPFLGSLVKPGSLEHTGPFSDKAHLHSPCTVKKIEEYNRHSFLYARIGQKDALAFPNLVPGSIVRVDQRRTNIQVRGTSNGVANGNRPLYLVEYPGGLVCSPVDLVDRDHIRLSPSTLPFACPQYRIHAEATILGTIDGEIRPVQAIKYPDVRSFQRFYRVQRRRSVLPRQAPLGALLRFHRERNGVSVRRAHQMTVEIAEQLGNSEYEISIGSLFEFEATDAPPRHVEKLFSLCIVYCIDLWTLLRTLNLPIEEAGQEPIPRHYLGSENSTASSNDPYCAPPKDSFCNCLGEMIEEIPLFLCEGFSILLPGLELTSRNLFWVGSKEVVSHPWLEGATLVAVDVTANGRSAGSSWSEVWERPIYLVLLRNDRYAIGFCSFDQGKITIVPHPECASPILQFVNGQDAEVLGRVTAIARLIPP